MLDWHWTQFFRAAAYCMDGDHANAQTAMQEGLSLRPDIAAVFWEELLYWNKGGETDQLLDNFRAGLVACGLDIPERPTPAN